MRRALTLAIVVLSSLACEEPELSPDAGAPRRDAGAPSPPACLEVTPSNIDFGEVEHPLNAFRRVELVNRSNVFRLVHAVPRTSPFFISPLDGVDLPLPPGAQRVLEVQFFAEDARLHLGAIELTAGPDCNTSITVRGLGSGSVRLEPETTDYGFLTPGQSKTLEVRLTNTRRTAVQVIALELQERTTGSAFSVNFPPVPFELPALSSRSFSITATPPTDLTFDAELVAATMFGVARATLHAVGGAPVAEVSPASIDVPIATWEPWARSPSWIDRELRLRNASTQGRSIFSRLIMVPPFAVVERVDGGPAPEVTVFSEEAIDDSGLGLDLNQSVAVPVRVTPTEAGQRSYRIRFFTNDPQAPEHVVALNVNTVSLGRCLMRVEPEADLFLEPTPDGRSRGTVSFINQGASRCVVDDPRMTSTSSTDFSIVSPVSQLVVESGATGTITLEGPRSFLLVDGTFTFHVLNPGSVRQFVVLHVPP